VPDMPAALTSSSLRGVACALASIAVACAD
jgi:hypothetical protein